MKKVRLLICAIAAQLLFVGAAFAATGTISGVVKDIATGSAIAGATVHAGSLTAVTNSSGAYSLNVNTGGYTLSTSASGYLTTNQIVTVGSSVLTVNWALTKSYGNHSIPASNMSYVVLAWNDLGMHCDQDDYSYFAVLPPFNTLHAQVFRHGGDSGLVTSGITVSYTFPKKTNSTLHTNFWTYAPQYGWNVPANVGITGTPLAGKMQVDAKGLGFVAQGIPITPYDDDGTWDPYGTAVLTVKDSYGNVLQTANVVAPVSTEMMCSNCHGTMNPQLDIIMTHDRYSGTTLYNDWQAGKVHLCAECHSSNALGAPGKAGIESLTLAMHNFHKDKMQYSTAAVNTSPDCYNCHPGPKTNCMRGIMYRAGKSCHDCHGDMNAMANGLLAGRQGWLQEPKCGNCHDANHAENSNTLYRNSVLQNGPTSDMNNRIYCEACHNSTHGEYTSANPADTSITQKFQGDNYWIWNCNVCHSGISQRNMHSGGSTSTTSTSGTSGTSTTSTSGTDD
jgi:carboxypeptidase family protein